jgi:hypothetical protein
VGAGFGHGKKTLSTTDQENGRAPVNGSGKFAVDQTCFRQNGGKLLWEYLAIGAVNAYSVLIHQPAAKVGCTAHNGIAQHANDATSLTRFLFSQKQRGCE